MVPSRVKDTTSATNADSVEPSFGKPKIGVLRPLEKGITIRDLYLRLIQKYMMIQKLMVKIKTLITKGKGKEKFPLMILLGTQLIQP